MASTAANSTWQPRPSGSTCSRRTSKNGQFRPLPIGRTFGLDDGRDAYRAVADRVPGQVVISP